MTVASKLAIIAKKQLSGFCHNPVLRKLVMRGSRKTRTKLGWGK